MRVVVELLLLLAQRKTAPSHNPTTKRSCMNWLSKAKVTMIASQCLLTRMLKICMQLRNTTPLLSTCSCNLPSMFVMQVWEGCPFRRQRHITVTVMIVQWHPPCRRITCLITPVREVSQLKPVTIHGTKSMFCFCTEIPCSLLFKS